VFLSGAPRQHQVEDISFSGVAGSVRVFRDEVHLIIAEGPGEVTYKQTTLRSPIPVVKVIPLNALKKETIEIPAPEVHIAIDSCRPA